MGNVVRSELERSGLRELGKEGPPHDPWRAVPKTKACGTTAGVAGSYGSCPWVPLGFYKMLPLHVGKSHQAEGPRCGFVVDLKLADCLGTL